MPSPALRKKILADKERRQNRVINKAVREMEAAMQVAVESVLLVYQQTGQYKDPSLDHMFGVSALFYGDMVREAFVSSQHEKKLQVGTKRLAAAKGPVGIPRNLRDLEQLFRDKRAWPSIMKRSKKLTEALRQSYLKKLRRKFKDLIPRLEAGEITTDEAKSGMMDSFKASKSRVETIFRTETTNYFTKVQVSYFEDDEEIIGFLFDSIGDKARTPICRSREGLVYRPKTDLLRKNSPALHYNCRSHLIAMTDTAYNRKMLNDPKRDPSKRSVVELPPGWRK